MEKEFVSYEIALALKELGFNEPNSLGYHSLNPTDIRGNNVRLWSEFNKIDVVSCKAITWHTAFRWFREKYDWTIKVNQVTNNNWSYTLSNFPNDGKYYGELYKTYEEAESACIDKLIEIVKNK